MKIHLNNTNSTVNEKVYTKAFIQPFTGKVRSVEITEAVVEYTPIEQAVVSKQTILNMSLCCFMDYTNASKITIVNDFVTQVNSENSGNIVFTPSSNTAIQLVDFGQSKALESVAAWHWIGSGSPTEKPGNNNSRSHMSMLFMRTGTTERRIFDDDAYFRDLFISATGGVRFEAAVDVVFNVSLVQDVPYLFSITKDDDEFIVRAEQLTNPFTIQTDTQNRTDTVWADVNNVNHPLNYGSAQYGLQGFLFSSLIILRNNDSADIANIHSYLKSQFSGVGEDVPGDTPHAIFIQSSYLSRWSKEKHYVDDDELDDRIAVLRFRRSINDAKYFTLETPVRFNTDPFKIGNINYCFKDSTKYITPDNFEITLKIL